MAHDRGWWKLELSGVIMDDLSEADRDHIAKAILDGYIGGEICADEQEEGEDDDLGVRPLTKEEEKELNRYSRAIARASGIEIQYAK